jgi:IS30 family transposase
MPAVHVMLSLSDREEISRALAEGMTFKEIAALIGRDASVVSREVRRHGGRADYRAVAADAAAAVARQRPRVFAVERSAWLAVPGHWEGDLVIGKNGKTAVATLVERTSRFLILVPLTGRDSLSVGEAVIAATHGLPAQVRRSLTGDCGSEMARHADITATGLPVFFAHPHSPGERGSNENLNRIVREFFPKGASITSDPNYLTMVAAAENWSGLPITVATRRCLPSHRLLWRRQLCQAERRRNRPDRTARAVLLQYAKLWRGYPTVNWLDL